MNDELLEFAKYLTEETNSGECLWREIDDTPAVEFASEFQDKDGVYSAVIISDFDEDSGRQLFVFKVINEHKQIAGQISYFSDNVEYYPLKSLFESAMPSARDLGDTIGKIKNILKPIRT